jgi:hypothetical protein
LRKVKLAGAREGGRRGAPRRRRATCTRYVAAAPARAAWAGVWGVTRGKRGGAGRGAGVCARREWARRKRAHAWRARRRAT